MINLLLFLLILLSLVKYAGVTLRQLLITEIEKICSNLFARSCDLKIMRTFCQIELYGIVRITLIISDSLIFKMWITAILIRFSFMCRGTSEM